MPEEVRSLPPIYIAYLNRLDIEELKITDDEILSAIEASLASQGRGETVIEPRMHLEPGVANGHFNVLRGAIKAPIDFAGRQDRRRLRRQLQARLSLRTRHPGAVRSAHRRAARRSSMPAALPTCAPARSPRSAPNIWRGRTRKSLAISARAAPPTGTCACSIICSISTRSAFIPAAKRAATRLRNG